jgi:hypothetical protein
MKILKTKDENELKHKSKELYNTIIGKVKEAEHQHGILEVNHSMT